MLRSFRVSRAGSKARDPDGMSASLIGRSRSSAFRLSAGTVSMSLAGSRFSSESAPRPFHHGDSKTRGCERIAGAICGHHRARASRTRMAIPELSLCDMTCSSSLSSP